MQVKDQYVQKLNTQRTIIETLETNANLTKQESENRLTLLDLKMQQLATILKMLNSSLDIVQYIVSQNNTFLLSTVDEEFEQLKEQNEKIISDIHDAAFKAQTDYQIVLEKENKNQESKKKLEDSQKKENLAEHLVGDVLSNLEGAVQQLEDSIHKDTKFEEGKKVGKLETVVKIDGDGNPIVEQQTDKTNNQTAAVQDSKKEDKEKHVASTLIDAENNQYVLTKANDPTAHLEDAKLFHDIVFMMTLSFVFGFIFEFLRLPSFFGYIVAGIILGPSYFNKIKSIIQIETIAQFGILFILFILGAEFSWEKIQRHYKATLIGGTSMTFFIVLLSVLIGTMCGFPVNQAIFFGASISLSSTTVVIKCLDNQQDTVLGQIIVGILVLQDMMLGLLLAAMPSLGSYLPESGFSLMAGDVFWVLLRTIGFVLCTSVIGYWIVSRLLMILLKNRHAELQVLGCIAFFMAFIQLSESLLVSIEIGILLNFILGVFMAGIIMNQRSLLTEQKLFQKLETIKDFFACLFFATIGLHIYPTFLVKQAFLLFLLTWIIMGAKMVVGFLIFYLGLAYDRSISIAIAVGLSQVSEFAIVLSSRAKSLKILNKEAYYLLIGATILSLLLTPFLWALLRKLLPGSLLSYSPKKDKFEDDESEIALTELKISPPLRQQPETREKFGQRASHRTLHSPKSPSSDSSASAFDAIDLGSHLSDIMNKMNFLKVR